MEARNSVIPLNTLRDVNSVLVNENIAAITPEEHKQLLKIPRYRDELARIISVIADERTPATDRFRAAKELKRMREGGGSATAVRQQENPSTEVPRVMIARDEIEDEKMRFVSRAAYGAKAAFTMQMAKSRPSSASEDAEGFYTVNIEAAPAKSESGGNRSFDWQNKITLQLTRNEIVVVAAVFYGFMPSCTFSSHGPANDKGFSMERKDGGIIARVNATGRSYAVKLTPPDIFYMGAILTRQLLAQTPWLDSQMLRDLLQGAFSDGAAQPGPAATSTQPAQPAGAEQNNAPASDGKYHCSECNYTIDQKITDYSTKKYGRALCLKCQKKR
ncbi:MAG: hypothetical protein ACYDCW_07615 [Acidithiobacillus ferrivorans]